MDKEHNFGEFIKGIREIKNMSLREVADKCTFSAAHLSNLENGQNATGRKVKATPEVIKQLSYVYKYPYPDLMAVAGYSEGYSTSYSIPKALSVIKEGELHFETIGERLSNLMNNKALTYTDLSHMIKDYNYNNDFEVIEFSSEQIEGFLKDETDPPSKFIVAASKFFRVSCDWLLTGREHVVTHVQSSSVEDKAQEFLKIMNEASKKIKELTNENLRI